MNRFGYQDRINLNTMQHLYTNEEISLLEDASNYRFVQRIYNFFIFVVRSVE
jgi:hypothetical protein